MISFRNFKRNSTDDSMAASSEKQSKKLSKTEANDLGPLLENIIIVAIVLVLVVTLVDEIAILSDWSINTKRVLLMLSFFFDLFFSIEFVIRLLKTSKHGAARHYFMHQRGWIDLISSWPLLLLNSGPEFLIYFFPDIFTGSEGSLAFFGTIKVVKAIRVTRILRLLRMVKILGKIQNTNSYMANRHIAVISTTAVMSIIITFAAFSFSGYLGFQEIEKAQNSFYSKLVDNIAMIKQRTTANMTQDRPVKADQADIQNTKEIVTSMFYEMNEEESHLVQIYYKNELLLSNYTREYLISHFYMFPERPLKQRFHDPHIHTIVKDDFFIAVNLRPVYKEKTRVQLLVFIAILLMILAFMTLYTRHFVQNVSDVVHVMKRGFKEPDFNLEVKIKSDFEEDEIFQLAKEYNEQWLPLKQQNKEKINDESTGGLTLNDFLS